MNRKVTVVFLLLLIFSIGVSTQERVSAEEDLSLEQAVREALATDPSLKEAMLSASIKEQEVRLNAEQLAISGGLDLNRVDYYYVEPDDVLSVNSKIKFNNKWSVTAKVSEDSRTVSLNYLPFNSQTEADRLNKEQALAEELLALASRKNQVIYGVRIAYIEAVQKEELYRLAEEDLNLAKEFWSLTEALYKAGKVSRLDLMEAEQQVKSSEAILRRTGIDREAAFFKLGTAMGRKSFSGAKLHKEEITGLTADRIDMEATLAAVARQAPELKPLQAALALNDFQIKTLARFPYADLSLSAAISHGKISSSSPEDETAYTLSIGLPFYDQAMNGKRELARKAKEVTETTIELKKEQLQTGILDAYQLWRTADLQLEPTRNLVEFADEKLKIVMLKYRYGTASGFEVIKARQELAAAKKDYWQAWLGLQQARENFYKLTWGNPVLNP